jgi:hypothetical protein
MDGIAGKPVYLYGDDALYRYSVSDAGRRALILPYKADYLGTYADRFTEWNEKHSNDINRIRRNFFLSAVRGEIDIESSWGIYLDELNTSGMRELLELIDLYPVAGR